MQGYNGSQLWDVALTVQAVLATNLVDEYSLMLKKAHDFIKNTQVYILNINLIPYFRYH